MRGLTYLISERQGKETDRKNEENVKKWKRENEGDVHGRLEDLTPATFVKQIKHCRGSSPVRTPKHTYT